MRGIFTERSGCGDNQNNVADALELSLKQAPIATPAQVKKEVSAINEKLLAKADEAQAAY
jgi:hypothetical protein